MHHHEDGEDQDRRRHLTYYAHHFRPPQALSTPPSNPTNITYLQEGFHLASAKKRKPDGGARVVQPAGKKDRHSKVRTARGPRDRRLRLSPRTAIQFYDVQDRLGYDRPSKAIDWLIREAQSAIDALSPDLPTNAPPNLIFPNPLIHQHSDAGNPAPGFGGAPPLPAELLDQDPDTARFYQQGLELQKMWAWDCGNGSFSGESPVVSGNGHVFYQREPLQSSFLNYSPMNYTDLGGFNFCNELSNVTAFATMKEDDQNLKSSTPPFLHHHDH